MRNHLSSALSLSIRCTRVTAIGAALFLLLSFVPHAFSQDNEVVWASRVLEYESGLNALPPFFQPGLALGGLAETVNPLSGSLHVVSIGQDGFLTLGFDEPVVNHRNQPDFIVYGNAFYSNSVERVHFQEPGWVEVGVDLNKNGQPDNGEPFYLLGLGMAPDPGAPPQFPLPPEYTGNVDHQTHPTIGYCDVTPSRGSGDPRIPDDPNKPGLTEGSAGGDAFDLDWAMDETGTPVHLVAIDFIRIHNAFAGTDNVGAPGTSSTEVDAVADLPVLSIPRDQVCRWELW